MSSKLIACLNVYSPVYTTLNFWRGIRTNFIRAGTTYLHGPSTDKISTGACFMRAVPKIKRSVNGAYKSSK